MFERTDPLFKPPSAFLPPPDVWVHDPYKDDHIDTPLDERGLVDTGELIRLMKLSVDPSYTWDSPFTDEHHLQWPNRWYDNNPDQEISPQRFRNLTISKIDTPRIFHNWVHLITEPPPVPTEEVMRYRIEAQNVAISLFRVAKTYSLLPRRQLSDASLERQLLQKYEDFSVAFERAKQIPKPFQLIDFDAFPLQTPEDMARIRKKIGKFAFPLVATDLISEAHAA